MIADESSIPYILWRPWTARHAGTEKVIPSLDVRILSDRLHDGPKLSVVVSRAVRRRAVKVAIRACMKIRYDNITGVSPIPRNSRCVEIWLVADLKPKEAVSQDGFTGLDDLEAKRACVVKGYSCPWCKYYELFRPRSAHRGTISWRLGRKHWPTCIRSRLIR